MLVRNELTHSTTRFPKLPMNRDHWNVITGLIALAIPLHVLACAPAAAEIAAIANPRDYLTAKNNLTVANELDIRQVIARLNHALDQADYELYSSFFTADAVFDTAFGQATGPEEIAAALEASRPFITNKRHVAANLVISGSGQQAMVTSYLIVFERAESLTYVGSAINVDTLVKRNGQWKVVRHETELDPATIEAMQAVMSQPAP